MTVISDPEVVAPALAYLDANRFCDPYPLRYETSRGPEREVWLTSHVLPDYQGSTVWTSLGAMYLQVLRTVDPALAATETARYVAWIERDGTSAGQNARFSMSRPRTTTTKRARRAAGGIVESVCTESVTS